MRRLTSAFAALALTLLTVPFTGPAAAADVSLTISAPLNSVGLINDGSYLAWAEPVGPGAGTSYRYDLKVYDLAAGRPIPLGLTITAPTTGMDGTTYGLSDGTLIWSEGQGETRPIYARRLPDGPTVTVASGSIAIDGVISRGTVAWWESAGPPPADMVLKARDITTMAPARTVTSSPFGPYGFGPSRAGDGWVAWVRGVGASKVVACWELNAAPLAGGERRVIADLGCGTPRFDMDGTRLAYIDKDGYLTVENLANGYKQTSGPHCRSVSGTSGTTVSCGGIGELDLEGRYVFWGSLPQSGDIRNPIADLWGFDPNTNSAFRVATGIPLPSVSAARGVVGWLENSQQGATIRAEQTWRVTPSAAEPRPASPDVSYFPETSHSLGGAFRSFWQRNGGLPVFGFPLTREFIQQAPESSQGFATQYFERQRFEYHPENAGTPYEVLLGRLGAEALAAQGVDWQQLPKASPSAPYYFAATGQAIAPEFYDYWRTHGLELGDAGMSQREALALFGYPISPVQEQILPDGKRIRVQWFERARFEFHPDNPPAYRVLLGRLAADTLARFGW